MPLLWKPLRSYIPPLLYDPPVVDIAVIIVIAFHFNIYRRDNEVFITSLYKIDQIINEREEKLAEEIDEELVKCLLFTIYVGYKDVSH